LKDGDVRGNDDDLEDIEDYSYVSFLKHYTREPVSGKQLIDLVEKYEERNQRFIDLKGFKILRVLKDSYIEWSIRDPKPPKVLEFSEQRRIWGGRRTVALRGHHVIRGLNKFNGIPRPPRLETTHVSWEDQTRIAEAEKSLEKLREFLEEKLASGETQTNSLLDYLRKFYPDCYRGVLARIHSKRILRRTTEGKMWLDFQVGTPMMSEFFGRSKFNKWALVSRNTLSKGISVSAKSLSTNHEGTEADRTFFDSD